MSVLETHETTSALQVDAAGLHYRDLNARIRAAIADGRTHIHVARVNGQRYIADGIQAEVRIDVHGVPGNDLGAFMDGPTVAVRGNAQDAIGNTMNGGKIVVHGSAGDVLGYGMRGGKIFIRGDVGYRVGIHMKAYRSQAPVLIAGGTAGDFLGEYMAGGLLVVLGLNRRPGQPLVGDYCATGMHGGAIYLRGAIEEHHLGREVGVAEPDEADRALLRELVTEFAAHFRSDAEEILAGRFLKLWPLRLRPYGTLYAY
jgi:glutamate synthase domain-containing protein 3